MLVKFNMFKSYLLDQVVDCIRVSSRHRANRAASRGVFVHLKNVQGPTEDRRLVHICDRDPDNRRVTERPQLLKASIYMRVGHLYP